MHLYPYGAAVKFGTAGGSYGPWVSPLLYKQAILVKFANLWYQKRKQWKGNVNDIA